MYNTVKSRIDPKYKLSYLRRISELLAQIYVIQGKKYFFYLLSKITIKDL